MRITYNVGFNVDTGKWNKETQRCKRNTSHGEKSVPASKINAEIQRYEDAVNFVASSFRTEPSVEDFKATLNEELKEMLRKRKSSKRISLNYTKHTLPSKVEYVVGQLELSISIGRL